MRYLTYFLLCLLALGLARRAHSQNPTWKTVYILEYRQDADHAWQRYSQYDTQQDASLGALFLQNQFYETRIRTERQLVRIHALTVRVFRGPWNAGQPTWIAGATVRLKKHASGDLVATATTDANGQVTFPAVSIGHYRIEVSRPGYAAATRVHVMPAYDSIVNVELERLRLPGKVRQRKPSTVSALGGVPRRER
ncbi:MAG: carboxypeptidase regulatory-like domain-containing protein [Planctomycetes bacterium]|nr:carboxypeptidase regulatory-like domain-containing protein [Planctomycetota bacterium]MCB9892118.1 carboxypeptidase regulatory-like domain-containing protein [Planctomycetota bacterium]